MPAQNQFALNNTRGQIGYGMQSVRPESMRSNDQNKTNSGNPMTPYNSSRYPMPQQQNQSQMGMRYTPPMMQNGAFQPQSLNYSLPEQQNNPYTGAYNGGQAQALPLPQIPPGYGGDFYRAAALGQPQGQYQGYPMPQKPVQAQMMAPGMPYAASRLSSGRVPQPMNSGIAEKPVMNMGGVPMPIRQDMYAQPQNNFNQPFGQRAFTP